MITACSVDCTEVPILGKDQIAHFDEHGKAHILIDNPLDIPVTLERGAYVGFEPELSYYEDFYDRLAALEKARAEAIENNILYKEMYAAQYNARHNVQEPSLSVGDLILVESRPDQNHKNAKLQNLYDGPFTIVRISIPNVYYQKGKKILVTHLNRIKRVNSPLKLVSREGSESPHIHMAQAPPVVSRPVQLQALPPSVHQMTTRSAAKKKAHTQGWPAQARIFH